MYALLSLPLPLEKQLQLPKDVVMDMRETVIKVSTKIKIFKGYIRRHSKHFHGKRNTTKAEKLLLFKNIVKSAVAVIDNRCQKKTDAIRKTQRLTKQRTFWLTLEFVIENVLFTQRNSFLRDNIKNLAHHRASVDEGILQSC